MFPWADLGDEIPQKSGLKIVELTELNTCKFCDNALGRYSCPRCNMLYCSLPCYQSEKHLECSESFYKDSVMENLDKNDESGRKKMMEILERFHEKNKVEEKANTSKESDDSSYFLDDEYDDIDDDNDDDDDNYKTDSVDSDDDDLTEMFMNIGERLAGIDLDDSEEVWDKLNDVERKEFEAFLLSGDVGKFITMWSPWWAFRCEKRCIEVTELDEQKSKCPKIKENIKPFSEISTKPPASCTEHNLMNVVAAYAFALRYFNGDHTEFPKETASCIFHLSLNLKKNQNYDSFNLAVNSVTMECTNGEFSIVADKENIEHVKSDVQMIVSGPHATEKKYYLLCALSDLNDLFNNASKAGDAKTEGSFYKKFTENQFVSLNLITGEDFKKSIKKIEYFLSFVKHCYNV